MHEFAKHSAPPRGVGVSPSRLACTQASNPRSRIKQERSVLLSLCAFLTLSPLTRASAPIVIDAPEQQHLSPATPDGDLPPLPGVTNIQVHRATAPNHTYHHHVDLAAWHGRLYLGWNSTAKDEDTGPSRQLFSTSTDATHWTAPQNLFPPDLAIPLRMYFYLAANHHMLAIAGLRTSNAPLVEHDKHALLVREILPDHTLGAVHTLQPPPLHAGAERSAAPDSSALSPQSSALSPAPPLYTTSPNSDFITACTDLLSNTNFLLQEDFGILLPESRRMPWNSPDHWPPSLRNDAQLFGKATAFFHRQDHTLVAISKKGWTTTSPDDGRTWSQPTIPPTLITGMAKVWPQRIADDQYALVYDPHPTNRFPLAIVSGSDGITFSHLRALHPTLPPLRYPGLNKVPGPQYPRGLSEFSNDHSFPDTHAMFVAYSMNKEDIWLTRIPTPIQSDPTDFNTPWNLYCPQWAPASLFDGTLRLEDADPADDAIATKTFPPTPTLKATFEYRAPSSPRAAGVSPASSSQISNLKFSLLPPSGPAQPILLSLPPTPEWTPVTVTASCPANTYGLTIGTKSIQSPFSTPSPTLGRLTFRTDNDHPLTPETDKPIDPKTVFEIRNITITP